MEYDVKQIIEDFNVEISKGYDKIYNSDVIKRYGTTTDTGEPYSEKCAREILKNIKDLENPDSIMVTVRDKKDKNGNRKQSYKLHHPRKEFNLEYLKTLAKLRYEERMARSLKDSELKNLGVIIDYQTPLYNSADKRLGKIDLLSYKEPNTVYMIEYKWIEANDTLLRCILEIYTYMRILGNKGKDYLLKDFDKAGANLKLAVLVYKSCQAYKDFIDVKCPSVISLMRALKVDFFVINDTHDKIIEPPYMS